MSNVTIIPTSSGPRIFETEEKADVIFNNAILRYFDKTFKFKAHSKDKKTFVQNILNSNATIKLHIYTSELPMDFDTNKIQDVVMNFMDVQSFLAHPIVTPSGEIATIKKVVISKPEGFFMDEICFYIIISKNGKGNLEGFPVPYRDLSVKSKSDIREKFRKDILTQFDCFPLISNLSDFVIGTGKSKEPEPDEPNIDQTSILEEPISEDIDIPTPTCDEPDIPFEELILAEDFDNVEPSKSAENTTILEPHKSKKKQTLFDSKCKIRKASKKDEIKGLKLYADAHTNIEHEELFSKGEAFLAGTAFGCLLMALITMLTSV